MENTESVVETPKIDESLAITVENLEKINDKQIEYKTSERKESTTSLDSWVVVNEKNQLADCEDKINAKNHDIESLKEVSTKPSTNVSDTEKTSVEELTTNEQEPIPSELMLHSEMEIATNTETKDEQIPEIAEKLQEIEKTKEVETPMTTKSANSLGLLAQYDSSSDEDEGSEDDNADADSVDSCDDDDEVVHVEPDLNAQAKELFANAMSKGNYRVASPNDTETESDDSDVEFVAKLKPEVIDITDEDELNSFMESCEDNTPKGPIKAKGEFGIDDLPPIADLTITVPESECIQLGTISGCVDTLVLVESLPNFAAVDIDTVLFLDKGNRTLGQVFDVMGNVASPIYCVRFNKAQDIIDKNISNGTIVYVAPKTEHTNFIVLSELMNQRGTDASWEDDIEPPAGLGDFSDDEEERTARRAHNQKQRNRNRSSVSSECDGHLPNKVTIKQENTSQQRNRRGNRNNRRSGEGHANQMQFYKDNRGYANTPSGYPNFYPAQQQQSLHYDHSWHTAAMRGMSSHIPPPPPPPLPSSGNVHPSMQSSLPQGCYPNPFAMQSNQTADYGHFNLQAFPPLPPPMNMQNGNPQTQFQQRNRFNYQFNKRNGQPPPKY